MDYRNALMQPRLSDRSERFRIPRDDGQAAVREAIGLVSVTAGVALMLGITVGLPVATMLNDICVSLKC